MDKEFKKINIDKKLYNYFLFNLIPQKKLFSSIKNLKDVFPKQKDWKNIETLSYEDKKQELISKFEKKGKFFKELSKHYVNLNKNACQDFNKFLESFDVEISTDELINFFNSFKQKYNMNIKDIVLFIHIYVEELLGLKMYKETTQYFEDELHNLSV